jgi:hypothetical protein
VTTVRRPWPVAVAVAAALVVLGCQSTAPTIPPAGATASAGGIASPAEVAPPAVAPATGGPASADPSLPPSDTRAIALAAARARWDAQHLATFAYTVGSWNSSGFGGYTVRVTSLEGTIRTQAINGDAGTGAALAPDALFAEAQEALAAPGTAEVTYDATTGLPTRIRASGPPGWSDADTNIDVSDFAAGPEPDAKKVKQAIAWALADWSRAQPASFTYSWTRAPVLESTPATSFEVARRSGGAATFSPATTDEGGDAARMASVPATLRAASAALASGAWVDLTARFGNGVPLLVAVDPTPAAGDAFWIAISFRDIEHEQAEADYRAAIERWTSAALTRYRYVWHYHGEAGTYTYRVTMRGDVSLLMRKKGTAVLWQAIDVGPRLDVLFNDIGTQLWSGARVVAAYDPTYGYPHKVTILSSDGTASGTIEISAFTVQ